MSRLVSRAESWERVYEALENINFAAFDYNSVKQSLLDYVKLYFPETFNDFIETSEFIAIVETFAYIAEQMAYRLDINAHENFISTAQRRDSLLRLAKLVSYTPSRPLPARGFVKITTISTTESVIDANGIDLANTTIRWNDSSNPTWKDQFILIMNRVLEQEFGTVGPNDRFQIQDVLFEVYGVDLVPLPTGVFKYTAVANNTSVPMELVSVERDDISGIVERRPYNNSNFTWLYASDGLGDESETTGFLCLTKQGTLQRYRTTFDGITPNQFYDVPATNVNDIDVWLNNVNPTTGMTLDLPNPLVFRPSWFGKSGEWLQVDPGYAQNVIFNTNPNRNKYEIETRDNNKVRLIFGDGEYADVPSGTFDAWVRTSVDDDVIISQTAVVNSPASFTYIDSYGKVQTFTFTFSLIGSLQNASAAETTEHIRTVAPAVYYTQDRMVNGQDYNTFMLQDPSILKLRSINRTFAGDSQYITWHDSSQSYENVKVYGNDGVLYYQSKPTTVSVGTTTSVDSLISNYVEPLLSSTDILTQLSVAGIEHSVIPSSFTTLEKESIITALTTPPTPAAVDLYYNKHTNGWAAVKPSEGPTTLPGWGLTDWWITVPLISINQTSSLASSYTVTRQSLRLVFESSSTAFWNTNESARVVDYDTLTSNLDHIVVLRANVNNRQTGVLKQDWKYTILGQEVVDSGTNLGLADVHRLSVLPYDENGDGIPDNMDPNSSSGASIADFFNYVTEVTITPSQIAASPGGVYHTLPLYYVTGYNDVFVDGVLDSSHETGLVVGDVVNKLKFDAAGTYSVRVNDYVYFTRSSSADSWYPVESSYENIVTFVGDAALNKRHVGRSGLNFAWFHFSPRYHLIDPAPSNIIDTFIITKGYYTEMKRWLEDPLASQPVAPTPFNLRSSYAYLLENKMMSDTVVLHPGKFKLLFGAKAPVELQAKFKVIRSQGGVLTDNQVKTAVVSTVRNFFDVTLWEFGESFFFTELAAAIHAALPTEISSVVLVPLYTTNQFGDMFQLLSREDEVFYPDITVDQVEIVAGFNTTNMRLNG